MAHNHPPRPLCLTFCSLLTVGSLAAACVEVTQVTNVACQSDEDCVPGVCRSGRCVFEDMDIEIADTGIGDTGIDAGLDLFVDAIGADTGSDAGGESDVDELADFGEACVYDGDCESGYCIDSDDGRICTRRCDDDCPEGYSCRLITTDGPDAVRLCIPESDILCRPCTNDTQCGSFQNFCVDQDNGAFCAIDCAQTRTCPQGYGCNPNTFLGEGPGGADLETWLCEPLNGLCHPITMVGGGFRPAACMLESSTFTMSGVITSSSVELTSPSFHLFGGL